MPVKKPLNQRDPCDPIILEYSGDQSDHKCCAGKATPKTQTVRLYVSIRDDGQQTADPVQMHGPRSCEV